MNLAICTFVLLGQVAAEHFATTKSPIVVTRESAQEYANILSVLVRPSEDDSRTIIISVFGPVRPGQIIGACLLLGDVNAPDLRVPLQIVMPTNTIKTPSGPIYNWSSSATIRSALAADCTIEIQLIGRDPNTVQSYQIPIKQFMPPAASTGPVTTGPGGKSPNQPVGPGGGR